MKAGTALAAVAAAAAMAPATAAADQRYASPAGTPAGACSQGDPCDFETAVEGAADGDEVIVQPGTHTPPGQVSLTTETVVHGVESQPAPRIVSAAGTAISVTDPGAVLRWLDVHHSGSGDGLLVDDGQADRLRVESSAAAIACHVRGAFLRDSVCWSTGAGGVAAGMDSAADQQSTILNVTASASGPGSRGLRVASFAGGSASLVARNTILEGAVDTELESDGASIAFADLDYSNFATQSFLGPNSFGTVSGTSFNQTAAPVFVDAAAGDFHQAEGSPTIDGGTFELGLGDLDVYGEPRVDGFALDIGADEWLFEPTPDTNPPDTRILKKPNRRAKRRLSRFKFGTTEPFQAVFMCSLDGKPYARCDSPKRLRVKRGKRHTFSVYSIDEAGNADPTPDEHRWRVRKKRG